MATRRRDNVPGKHTNLPSKTNSVPLNQGPTESRKTTPIRARPSSVRGPVGHLLNKQPIKIRAPMDANTKPAHAVRRRPDMTPLQSSQKTQVSTNPQKLSTGACDRTPLPAQPTQVRASDPSIEPRDKTPLPAQRRQGSTINPAPRSRDRTPLPEQKRHSSISSLRARDKTPQLERKAQIPSNPTIRALDKTPQPERKTQIPSNPTTRARVKTPQPERRTQITSNPTIRARGKTPQPEQKTPNPSTATVRARDKTPQPEQKTQSPSNPTTRGRYKTPLPKQKVLVPTNDQPSWSQDPTTQRKSRISTNPSPRLSSIPEKKNYTSQKTCPGRNPKPLSKDIEKRPLSDVTVSTTLNKSSIINSNSKVQETENSDSLLTEELITNTFQENAEIQDLNDTVLGVESLLEDQESFAFLEGKGQIVQVRGDEGKGISHLVPEEEENLAPIKAESDNVVVDEDDSKDDKMVTDELSPIEEQEEAPLDAKKQELEEKWCAEEGSEGQNVQEIENSNDAVESVADNYPKEENEEKEVRVEEAEVVEKEETREIEADKSEAVTEPAEKQEKEVIEKKKQEPENAAAQKQVWPRGKKDSAISNDMIEETATKLREQRKNRVRALAGAFESVISSQ